MAQSMVSSYRNSPRLLRVSNPIPQSSSTLDNLERLASKPGVQATLILSKVDGAIVRSTGLASRTAATQRNATDFGSSVASTDEKRPGFNDEATEDSPYGGEVQSGQKTAEDVAKMVFSFISSAGGLVSELDAGNEIQLLRLRTKKNEIVIVPGESFIADFQDADLCS